MTSILDKDLGAFRKSLDGQVVAPDDPGYDAGRSVWNGDIDRRPAAVVHCWSPADVAAAIEFGRAHGLELSVRGGGHSTSGAAVSEGGLMIHLGALNQVTVDPVARRARVGGGATLAEMDAATQAHGLAVTGGVVSHTGVGGLTLGGGMGWLHRKLGLSIDNLLACEVVLADGRIVRPRVPGPVLGAARRRRELRRGYRVRVRTAPGRPRGARRAVLLGPGPGSRGAAPRARGGGDAAPGQWRGHRCDERAARAARARAALARAGRRASTGRLFLGG